MPGSGPQEGYPIDRPVRRLTLASSVSTLTTPWVQEIPATLQNIPLPEEPAGFVDFWRQTYFAAREIDLQLSVRQSESDRADTDVYEIAFNAWGEVRIGGWLTRPSDGSIPPCGVVHSHGYGGRSGPDYDVHGPPAVRIFPCARGFDRSRHPDLPSQAAFHVIHGIHRRETYLHRGCVTDIWGAASALLELFPELSSNLCYCGASFGGGMGALAVPWDHRFRRAFLDVPSFGNHPIRLQTPCTGSGQAVRILHARKRGISEVLAYFDAAISARYFSTPVFVAAALEDPGVPPAGQFSVYQAIPGQKVLYPRISGHPYDERDAAPLTAALKEWWRNESAPESVRAPE